MKLPKFNADQPTAVVTSIKFMDGRSLFHPSTTLCFAGGDEERVNLPPNSQVKHDPSRNKDDTLIKRGIRKTSELRCPIISLLDGKKYTGVKEVSFFVDSLNTLSCPTQETYYNYDQDRYTTRYKLAKVRNFDRIEETE